MTINILGTEYTIEKRKVSDDKKLENMSGYCDDTIKLIVVTDYSDDSDVNSKADLSKFTNKVIRHEIVHAFLFESGLACNSEWADNEELVDWIAIQFPKIKSVYESIEVL